MAAKLALLISSAVCTAAAENCDAFACKMPKPGKKDSTGDCPDTGCTVDFCCEYTWADTCDIQKLGCVKGNGDGWVPKTKEQAETQGRPWPPSCVASNTTMCNVDDCCAFDEEEEQATPTTTFTPWDSSASSSADQDSLESSYFVSSQESNGKDSSGSVESSGSTASGSSGYYMKIYLWAILISALTICFCGVCLAPFLASPKKRASKKPKPQPDAPAPAVEEELLLPPLVPVVPEMPVTTSIAMPTYAPTYGAYPAYATAMPMAQPMATGYVV